MSRVAAATAIGHEPALGPAIAIVDEKGAARKEALPRGFYGGRAPFPRFQDGEHGPPTAQNLLPNWDPFTFSILTETAGNVKV